MSKVIAEAVLNLFKQSITGCGPEHKYTAWHRDCVPDSSKYVDIIRIQANECYHPQVKVYIDFNYQFTFEEQGGKKPLTKEVFMEYAKRLYTFVSYYFGYGATYRDKTTEDYAEIGKWFRNPNWQDEEAVALFVNEVINYFLTNVSVDRGRDSIGTCTLAFRDNLNITGGKKYSVFFSYAHSVLEQLFAPMLPIQVYARGRFYKDWYFPIFDGYLNSFTQSNANGFTSLTVSCMDLLELARTSTVMVSPAVVIAEEYEKQGLNMFSKPFYGKDHFEIFKLMFQGGPLTGTGIKYGELGQFTYTGEDAGDELNFASDEKAIHKDNFSLEGLQNRTIKNIKRKLLVWGDSLTPYRTFGMQAPDCFTSEFSNRLDILREIASMCYYDMYVDGAGNVNYHPWRLINDYLKYDMMFDIKRTKKHEHPFPGSQVIGLEEVLNQSSIFAIEELITFLHLEGQSQYLGGDTQTSTLTKLVGSAQNKDLMKRYGYRRASVKNPLFCTNFNILGNVSFMHMVALALLDLQNSELYTKQSNIVFRPELELAMPVYFTDDETVFYVNSLSHSIDIGGEATTSINCSHGRKAYEKMLDLQSIVLYSEKMYKGLDKKLDVIDQAELLKQLPIEQWQNSFDNFNILQEHQIALAKEAEDTFNKIMGANNSEESLFDLIDSDPEDEIEHAGREAVKDRSQFGKQVKIYTTEQ